MSTLKNIQDGIIITSNTTLNKNCPHVFITDNRELTVLNVLAKLIRDYSANDIAIYCVDSGNTMNQLNTQIGFIPIPHISAYICNCTFIKASRFLQDIVKDSYDSGKQVIVIDIGVSMYKGLGDDVRSEFDKHNVYTISFLSDVTRPAIPGMCFVDNYHLEQILSIDEILRTISRAAQQSFLTIPVKADKWIPTTEYKKFSSRYALKIDVGVPVCLSEKDNCAVIAGTTGSGVTTMLRFIYSRLMDTYSPYDLKILQISEPTHSLTGHFIETTDAFNDIVQLIKCRTDLYNWSIQWGKKDQLVFPAILVSVVGSVKKAREILKLVNENSHLNIYLLWTTQEYHSITDDKLHWISHRFVLRCPAECAALMLPSAPVWITKPGRCIVYNTQVGIINHVEIPYISDEEFAEHFKERNLL